MPFSFVSVQKKHTVYVMSLLNDEKAIRTWKNGQNSPLMVQYLRSDKKIHGGATYAHLKYFSKPKKTR